MPGLDLGIHAFLCSGSAAISWMAGSDPRIESRDGHDGANWANSITRTILVRGGSERVKWRLFTEAELASGGAVTLDGTRAHYLRNVLRLAPGAEVALFNGRDGEFRARIERLGKSEAELLAGERLRPQAPEPDVWLLFAPIKRQAIDLLAEKATELGVGRLMPVITRHTDVTRVATERLTAIAIEAAEQCGRLSVPAVEAPRPLDAILSGWHSQRRLYVCAEQGAAAPIAEVAAHGTKAPFALLVGPEGGFAASELDHLRNLDFVSALDLGPRILRAETAALAALAILQAWLGDWS
jgi:16S rRNA (uracil1498-N3)-methyltransferase